MNSSDFCYLCLLYKKQAQKDLDDNPHLRFAEGSDDTGVIISHTEYPFITIAYGEALESIFGKESYHNSEYTLFHNNIKENVRKRIAAFSR